MPRVRVRPYRRYQDEESKPATVLVVPPPLPPSPPIPTFAERVKKTFAVPRRKRKAPRVKTEAEEFADDAERLAKTLERMDE